MGISKLEGKNAISRIYWIVLGGVGLYTGILVLTTHARIAERRAAEFHSLESKKPHPC